MWPRAPAPTWALASALAAVGPQARALVWALARRRRTASDAERERVSRRSLALAWHSTSGRNTGSSACATPSTRFSTSIAFCITAAISASFAPEGSAPDDCHRTSITR